MEQGYNTQKDTIVFITGALQQPRIIKRIKSLLNGGFKVSVYGYKREFYKCNSIETDINVTLLSEQRDGTDYISKIISLKKDIDNIEAFHGKQAIYYCTSIVSAILLRHKKLKYIYEISDILYGYPKFRLIEPFLKWLDKKNIRESYLTVMTSQGFSNYLFGNRQLDNVLVQPNKLNTYFNGKDRHSLESISTLRFAFVGAIRYKNTILRFAEIIGKHYPKYEFHFYGEGIASDDAKKLASTYLNVFYHGSYKNPEDIEEIYANIDIVVAAYETSSKNELIAEPNKLYESMFFCKPIIVSKGTFLASQVERFDCGFSIDAGNDMSIISFLNELKLEEVKKISAHLNTLNPLDLIDDPTYILERINHN